MRFQKGQSGNPAGRPPGSRNKSTVLLQSLLEGEAEAITRKVIALAKEGDMAAIKLCMDRLAPPRRSAAVECDLPPLADRDDALSALAALVAAVSAGDVTPSEATAIGRIIDQYPWGCASKMYQDREAAKEIGARCFSACCLQAGRRRFSCKQQEEKTAAANIRKEQVCAKGPARRPKT